MTGEAVNPRGAANFDRLAGIYRWLEYASFGPWLQRCRCAHLPLLGAARRALVLGDGDGRFLRRLMGANPEVVADVVDLSPGMLRTADRRLARWSPEARRRLRFRCADMRLPASFLDSADAQGYDLVVSHFSLDCLSGGEVDRLAAAILPRLAGEAIWVVSEFSVCAAPLLAPLSSTAIASLYRAFGLLTGLSVRSLPDYAASLRRIGLHLDREVGFLAGLLKSQVWTRSGDWRP
jgi:SAM-dependent methyltransferase